MKLKSIIGLTITLGIIACATSAFAADEDHFIVGKPYDLSTGEYTTSLVSGHYLAIPVDITTTTGGFTSYEFTVDYTKAMDYLSAGIDITQVTTDQQLMGKITGLGGSVKLNMDSTKAIAIDNCGTLLFNSFTPAGALQVNADSAGNGAGTHSFVFAYAANSRYEYKNNAPEEYMLFTVVKDSNDETLNEEVFSFPVARTRLADVNMGKDVVMGGVPGTLPKLNSCAGAFQVKIDGTKVPADTWIRNVYAQQNGHDKIELLALEGEGDTGTYIFPVRVQLGEGSSAASATFNITATVTTTKNGSDESTVNLGSVEVPLSGTVSSYETNSLNATVTK